LQVPPSGRLTSIMPPMGSSILATATLARR
jgi:hypothetical protein